MLFAVVVDNDKRFDVTTVVLVLLLALFTCGHVAVGEGKVVLVEPAFGLVAVHTVGGALHDDVLCLNGLS